MKALATGFDTEFMEGIYDPRKVFDLYDSRKIFIEPSILLEISMVSEVRTSNMEFFFGFFSYTHAQ